MSNISPPNDPSNEEAFLGWFMAVAIATGLVSILLLFKL